MGARPYQLQLSAACAGSGAGSDSQAVAVGPFNFHVTELTAVVFTTSSGAILTSEIRFRLQRDSQEFLQNAEISSLFFAGNPVWTLPVPWELFNFSNVAVTATNTSATAATLRVLLSGILVPLAPGAG